MGATLALIAAALELAPKAIAVGIDAADLIMKARAALDANEAPSDVDWQALDQRVTDLQKQLNTDPPPA